VGRERDGRRNSYEVRTDLPVSLALERDLQLGDLLGAVFTTREPVTAEN
jgi:hypothetical protein